MNNIYAHPMLEPLNYDLDPEKAAALFSGDILKVYTLLWNAAVAALAEGPVIRKHTIEAKFNCSPSGKSVHLAACWTEIIEDGWMTFLPNEKSRLTDSNINTATDNELLTVHLPEYDPMTLSSEQSSHKINISLDISLPWTTGITINKVSPFTFSELLESMENRNVARPSTYASRIDAALKHNLIKQEDQALSVHAFGKEIVESITRLPPSEQLNANFCNELENNLNIIETTPDRAGHILDKYCKQLFNSGCNLSQWIDSLVVDTPLASDTTSAPSQISSTIAPTVDLYTSEFNSKSTEANISRTNKIGIDSTKTIPPLLPQSDPDTHNGKSSINQLNTILRSHDDKFMTRYTEIDWDNYIFESKIVETRFKGQFYTRGARIGSVSKSKIFTEHLQDYSNIVHYCLLRTIPEIELVTQISFKVQCERPQGMLYLVELEITYNLAPEHSSCLDKETVLQRIEKNLSEFVLFESIYLILTSEVKVHFYHSAGAVE